MTIKEYLAYINEEPTNVLKVTDGDYDYQPISHIRDELDRLFDGEWSFELNRETVGKAEAIAQGTLHYKHPATGYPIFRSGTAALPLSRGLRLDYPKLSAACLMNSAKSIGRRFGRDLNKDKDDIPIVVVEKEGAPDEQFEAVRKNILETIELHGVAKAKSFLEKSGFRYHPELKLLLESKKPNE